MEQEPNHSEHREDQEVSEESPEERLKRLREMALRKVGEIGGSAVIRESIRMSPEEERRIEIEEALAGLEATAEALELELSDMKESAEGNEVGAERLQLFEDKKEELGNIRKQITEFKERLVKLG